MRSWLVMIGAALVNIASTVASTRWLSDHAFSEPPARGFAVLVLAGSAAVVGVVVAFPQGRCQLRRLWRAALVGLLWALLSSIAGAVLGIAAGLLGPLVPGEFAMAMAAAGLLLSPGPAALGVGWSCRKRAPEHGAAVFATAALSGAVVTAAWQVTLASIWVFIPLATAVLAVVASSAAAAVCEVRAHRSRTRDLPPP